MGRKIFRYLLLIAVVFQLARAEIADCKKYREDKPDLCAECNPRFALTLDAKLCIACSDHCAACKQLDEASFACTTCDAGFYSYENSSPSYPDKIICLKCDSNCAEDCVKGVGCNKCKANFFSRETASLKEGGKYCAACDPQCKTCIDGEGCSACNDKFFKTDVKEQGIFGCQACDSSCEDCKDGIGCNKCKASFYVGKPKSPSRSPQNCQECDSNCIDCKDLTGCAKCKPSFFTLLKPDVQPGKVCEACDSNCETCVDDKGCETCKQRYFPSRDQGSSASGCHACMEACQSCDSGISCKTCDEGFYYSGSKCSPCQTEHCKACDLTNTCSECKTGYSLAKQGTGKPTCSLENQPGKSGGGSLIIILLVIGIICAIGGFGIYWYIQHKKQKEDGLSLYHGDRTDSLHN